MTAVISDTSPIRALNHLGMLPILRHLFQRILIPPAVKSELTLPSPRFAVVDISRCDFIEVRAPQDRAKVQTFLQSLNLGESEALALALEVNATIILMDEKAGRKTVEQHGIVALGTLGVLLRGKRSGFVGEIRPLIERLCDELDFFLSGDLKSKVLRSADE